MNPVSGQSLWSVLIRDTAGPDHNPRTFQSEDLIHNECLVFVDPATEFPFDFHNIHPLVPHGLCALQELVDPVLRIAIFYPSCALLFQDPRLDTRASKLELLLEAFDDLAGAPGLPWLKYRSEWD